MRLLICLLLFIFYTHSGIARVEFTDGSSRIILSGSKNDILNPYSLNIEYCPNSDIYNNCQKLNISPIHYKRLINRNKKENDQSFYYIKNQGKLDIEKYLGYSFLSNLDNQKQIIKIDQNVFTPLHDYFKRKAQIHNIAAQSNVFKISTNNGQSTCTLTVLNKNGRCVAITFNVDR